MPQQHEHQPPFPPGGSSSSSIVESACYPEDAHEFVRQGLAYTVGRVHGENPDPKLCRHVCGQQLCEGLREYALSRWGMMARTVLRRWNINRTEDFGRIVFAMIECGEMAKTDAATIEE